MMGIVSRKEPFDGGGTMVIYAEYLFLENFMIGLMLLYFTWKLMEGPGDRPPSGLRLAAGAALCGGSGFLLFLPVHPAGGLLLRAGAGLFICTAAFGRQKILKKTFLFLIISILSGGMAMAVFLWMEIPVLAGSGAFYTGPMTWMKLILCTAPAMVLAACFIRMVKQNRRSRLHVGMAELELEEYRCTFRGWIDSGNSLRDPVRRRPVILIDVQGAERLPFRKEAYPERFMAVPFQAVGVEAGLLEGLRIDRVRFGDRTLSDVVLAYYEGSFQGFEVLLHRSLMEGGMLDDEIS